jgi:hypothetical protein
LYILGKVEQKMKFLGAIRQAVVIPITHSTKYPNGVTPRFLLVIASVAVVVCLASCFWVSTWVFEPVKESKTFTMFQWYDIEASGIAQPIYSLHCDVSFYIPHDSTANVDTIPIFVMDSLWLEGECVGGVKSIRFNDPSKTDRPPGFPREYHPPDPNPDLLIGDRGKLWPKSFFSQGLSFPTTCLGNDLRVRFFARLVNRVTGEVIASESKLVQFETKKCTRPTLE